MARVVGIGGISFSRFDEPSDAPFMINCIVDDLDAMLEALRQKGVQVDERVEEYDYGKFGWIMDPDGNRIELWEPKAPTETSSAA